MVHSICAELPDLNEEEVLSSVLKREQGISTTLDTGLSIPHARIEDLEAFQAAAAVLPNPIKDDYGLREFINLVYPDFENRCEKFLDLKI